MNIDFIQRIRKLAKGNDAFRRELTTTDRLQVVLMCLQPGEDIGAEIHDDTDQVLVVVKGEGHAIVGGERHAIEKGSMVVVPAGTLHNLVNDSGESLRLYTIYVPPHHPPGTVHLTRADAMAAEDAAHPTAEITQ
jgi:mannose-6-phosphate isomerase-like protein (cupin superfamily)